MGQIATSGRRAFRDFQTDGIPATEANHPSKPEIRTVFNVIDAVVSGIADDVTDLQTVVELNEDNSGLISGGDLGDYLTRTGANSTDIGWRARSLADQQPSSTQVWSGSDFEIRKTTGAQTYTSAVDDDDIVFTDTTADTIWYLGALTTMVSAAGKSFTHTVEFPDTATDNAGIVIGWDPTPPSGAGPNALSTNARLFQWTSQAFSICKPDVTADTAYTFDAGGTDRISLAASDTVSVTLSVNDDETAATFYLTRNGNFLESRTLTNGSVPTGNIFFGVRLDGTNGSAWRMKPAQGYASAFPITKHIYIDPNVGSVGGIGTDKNPYLGADAISDINRDSRKGRLEVFFKPGICLIPNIIVDNRNWRQAIFRGTAGRRTQIRSSEEWTDGWTQIGSGNTWKHAYTTGFYGLVNKSKTQAMGRTGVYTHDEQLLFYLRNVDVGTDDRFLLDPADLALDAHIGHYLIDATGYEGYFLLNTGGDDPNTQAFEHATGVGLSFNYSNDDDWNVNEAIIEGLEFQYGSGGVTLNRCRGRLENVTCRSQSPGGGFQFNQSDVRAWSLYGYGTEADNFNMSGAISGGADLDYQSRLVLTDCHGYGCSPFFDGDNFSNHRTQDLILIGCSGTSSSKTAWGGSNHVLLIDFCARDCPDAGIELVPYGGDGSSHYLEVRGGTVDGCDAGVKMLGLGQGNSGVIDMQGMHTSNIVTAHVWSDKSATDSATQVLNVYPTCTRDSSGVPTKIGTNGAGTSTINIIAGTAYVSGDALP